MRHARGRARATFGHCPRNDHLVTNVLVNLSGVIVDRVRSELKHAIEERMNHVRSKSLAERSRSDDVNEKKESFLGLRAMISAQCNGTKRALADELAQLKQQQYEQNQQDCYRNELPKGQRSLDLLFECKRKISANRDACDYRNDANPNPGAGEYKDHDAVCKYLDRNGDEKRRVIERFTEARPREKHFRPTDECHERCCVDGAGKCAQSPAEQRWFN